MIRFGYNSKKLGTTANIQPNRYQQNSVLIQYKVKPIVYQKLTEFPNKIIIQDRKTTILEVKKDLTTLVYK